LDSQREIDAGIGKYFSQEPLGENEVMISNNALRNLRVSKDRKE